jgi:hypothetical protein
MKLRKSYRVCTTAPRLTQGEMTNAGIRCASTWSAPSWESSSTTKMADERQIFECEMTSTMRPTASSLSATIARGVRLPPLRPRVWSLVSVR